MDIRAIKAEYMYVLDGVFSSATSVKNFALKLRFLENWFSGFVEITLQINSINALRIISNKNTEMLGKIIEAKSWTKLRSGTRFSIK